MIKWLERNKRTLIRLAFLIPIISVAAISISHVVSWYDLANPVKWAIYLSIAVEIAAMSAIAAASVKIRGFSVWFVFSIVSLIQFIGNIYFSYTEIDVASKSFKDWIDLISPITAAMGSDVTDLVAQRRFLAFLEGGLLPLISLTCLHFFIGYSEFIESNSNDSPEPPVQEGLDEKEELSTEEEVYEDLKETEITSNVDEIPQIDNNEAPTESANESNTKDPIDYTQPAEKPNRTTGIKINQLSEKMKKILRK